MADTPHDVRRDVALESVDAVMRLLESDSQHGLGSAEVARRSQMHGPNELDVDEPDPAWKQFLEQFKEPLVLLLLGSAFLSCCLGQWDDAASITVAVLIVCTVAFVQERNSEQSIAMLKTLVPPQCHVVREGASADMGARDLVPGDVVLVRTGDRVPADCRLIRSAELLVDESSLTGETLPVGKSVEAVAPSADLPTGSPLPISECTNVLFMGTLVCAGHGAAVVVGTGMRTEFGKTVAEMNDIEEVTMDALGASLSAASLSVIGVVGLIGVLQGKAMLAMFQIGISLAVAAIPEGLPVCVTVTLALGVIRMSRKNAIVKKLPVVEALGCATVVCVDKTGTLTQNAMTVCRLCVPSEPEPVEVSGVGYAPEGQLFRNPGRRPIPKADAANGACPAIAKLLEAGCACNNARLVAAGSGAPEIQGQSTEAALLVAAAKLGVADPRLAPSHERVHEVPFSSTRKRMEVQCRSAGGGPVQYFAKGMFEAILDSCAHTLAADGTTVALSDAARDDAREAAAALGRSGLRVLALATGAQPEALTYLGTVGIRDPPRPQVQGAIATLRSSGVRVVMVTGDAQETALSIASDLGFYEPSYHASVSGTELDAMSRADLDACVGSVAVFYRTSPRHKLLIVQAMQRAGDVTAMTGDGVNDAPALKAADIGVAMGCGTDVAKEAADMVIVDDDLSTINAAVEEGKAIYYNIKNFLTFQLSTSVAALSLVAISTCLSLPNPLNAMQILWINIIMDGPPAQSLGVEPVDRAVSLRPPRKASENIISRAMLYRVFSSAAFILGGTLYVFAREMEDGIITRRDTTMTFTTFVMFDMCNALACRSSDRPFYALGAFANMPFVYSVGGSLLGQLAVIYFPPLQGVFQTEALSLGDLVFIAALASSLLVLDTVRKTVPMARVVGFGRGLSRGRGKSEGSSWETKSAGGKV